jgi:hypothetical protein
MKYPASTEVEAGKELTGWARGDSNVRPLARGTPEASDGLAHSHEAHEIQQVPLCRRARAVAPGE